MSKSWRKTIIAAVAGTIAVVATAWFAWPRPQLVELGLVASGPMNVTVEDEGIARIRHVYTVSAPTAGRVLRISHPAAHGETSLHVGDDVVGGETVVAVLQPTIPGLLDVRSREELQAAVAAADAAVKLAQAEVDRVQASLDFARSELQRARSLANSSTISAKSLDKARLDVTTNEAALASAKAQLDIRRSESAIAIARMLSPSGFVPPSDPNCCIQIRAPASGKILRVLQESEAVVPGGTPLVEIGDPSDLEVAVDLLSSDAVQVQTGSTAIVDGWGGPPLQGRVTRVDPAGFSKVSALGIEEQRVATIVDLTDPREAWRGLGHNFRVLVHVAIWQDPKVTTVPSSALFRQGQDWAVFVERDGRASVGIVRIGHRNAKLTEVLSGLLPGDRILLHPSDRIMDGTPVIERKEAGG